MEGSSSSESGQLEQLTPREAMIRRDLTMVILSQTNKYMDKVSDGYKDLVTNLTQLVWEETAKMSQQTAGHPQISDALSATDTMLQNNDTRDTVSTNTNKREDSKMFSKFEELVERIKFSHSDDKLDTDGNFFIWLANLRSELQAQGVLYCIDNSVPVPPYATNAGIKRVEDKVMHLIRSRISDDLHSIIMQCRSAKEMVDGIENTIVPISKTNEYSLRAQFGNLKFEKGSETAVQFIQRYEMLIRQMRRCPGISMTDDEKKTGFVMAVRSQSESVRVAESASQGKLSYENLKALLRDEELLNKDAIRRDTASDEKALLAKKRKIYEGQEDETVYTKKQRSDLKCFSCGVTGHGNRECPNKNKGKLCYSCQKFTKEHLASTCPQRSSGSALFDQKTNKSKPALKIQGLKVKRLKGGKPKMRKLAYRKAVKFGKARKNKGKNALIVFTDTEDEECIPEEKVYYVDSAELCTSELQEADRCQGSDTDEAPEAPGLVNYAYSDDEDTPRAYNLKSKSIEPTTLTLVVDSGATEHFVRDKFAFTTLRELPKSKKIICANSKTDSNLFITNEGDIAISADGKNLGLLKNVLYAPTISENLFSLKKLRGKGICVTFTDNEVEIKNTKEGFVMAKGQFRDKLWRLTLTLPLANKRVEIVSDVLEGFSESESEKRGSNCNARKRKIYLTDEGTETSTSQSIEPLIQEEPLPVNPTKKQKDNAESTTINAANQINEEDLIALQKKRETSVRECKGLLWHYHLNHASKGYLEIASKVLGEMKGVKLTDEILDCEACKLAKAKRKPFQNVRARADAPLVRVHSDLMGKISPCSLRFGANYIISFTDDYSRFCMAFPIADKTMVHFALKDFLKEARRLVGDSKMKLQEIRTDGGTEYKTQGMRDLLREEGISLDICAPATPQHNGVAERLNLELQEKIRANLLSSGMPAYYWSHALSYTVHVHNRTPNKSIEFKTPYELFTGRKPNIGYIRRFGSEAYVVNPKPKAKFAARARLAYLLECNETCYTLFAVDTKTLIRSRDVDFVESRVYGDKFGPDAKLNLDSELTFENEAPNPIEVTNPKHQELIGESSDCEFYEERDDHEMVEYLALLAEWDDSVPAQYKDAVNSRDWPNWSNAINDELDSHERCGTWQLVKRDSLPPGTTLIKTRWVNRKKTEVDGKIRYKSRLVAKGFADRNIYDKSEVYAPVARLGDIRFLIAAVNKFNLDWVHLDVKTAFLNGKIEKPVFMEIPDGLEEKMDQTLKDKFVCELKKSIYGLKISPKRWYVEFSETMKELGFETYPFQSCLFIFRQIDEYVIGLLYVDDLILASSSTARINRVKAALMNKYEMTDLGEPKKYLGMEIERDRSNRSIFVHQQAFTKSVLAKFGIHGTKTSPIPMATYDSSRKTDTKKKPSAFDKGTIPFRQAIGSLIYLMNGTRPDISVAVNVLSRRQADFDKDAWTQVNKLFRYLLGTENWGICFKGERDDLLCYPDASLGISDPKGLSTTGFAVLLFGDLISWKTKKQTHVAQSSSEAEFVAMSQVCREAASIRDMCKKLLGLQVNTILFEDNQAAITLAKTEESKTLKHFVNLFYHYVRSEFANGNVDIRWISTDQQLGDFFTKPLAQPKFETFRNQIMHFLDP